MEIKKIAITYLANFFAEYSGVITSTEIEPVHKMRVASRRLRAALSVLRFFYKNAQWKLFIAQLKKTGKVLGQARQLDVLLRFFKNYKINKNNFNNATQLNTIIKDIKVKRKTVQKEVISILNALSQYNKITIENNLINTSLKAGVNNKKIFFCKVCSVALKQIEKIKKLSIYAKNSKNTTELHKLRVCIKKLRYILEFSNYFVNYSFDSCIKELCFSADMLGDLHEGDVVVKYLLVFDKQSDASFNEVSNAIICDCDILMQEVYSKYIKHWSELENSNYWGTLKKVLLN